MSMATQKQENSRLSTWEVGYKAKSLLLIACSSVSEYVDDLILALRLFITKC